MLVIDDAKLPPPIPAVAATNMNVVYDPRVNQIVGFGTVTLDIDLWRECTVGAVTDSSC